VERGSLIYIAFLFRATISGVLGVVMKYFFQLYPVAHGTRGTKRLELLVHNGYRRFGGVPRQKMPWHTLSRIVGIQ
jgi:hypothetical protein